MSNINGEQNIQMDAAGDVKTEKSVKENGLPNGTRLPITNGLLKVEAVNEVHDMTNGNGHGTTGADDQLDNVMEGMDDIKISDSMDVDGEDIDDKKVNGVASRDEITAFIHMKANGMSSRTLKVGNFAVKSQITETLNGIGLPGVPHPPPIVPKCANSKLTCASDGLSTFPCKRCHRIFYCCDDHRNQHFKDHQPDCKTISSLEVMYHEEEYSMWLKHAAPHLYDVCLNFILVWPSLTAQWLPEVIECENEVLRHQLLLGTMTNQEQNHLLICGVDVHQKSKSDGSLDHNAKFKGTMYVTKRINHEAEVNRARYMPQDCNIVATKSSSPEVFIFDCSKYPEVPEDSKFAPLLRLRGHQKEGFGLSWNLKEKGKILSGSNDALVCLWDLNMSASSDNNVKYLNASRTFRGHEDVVEDVDWHQEHRYLFSSVGDDKRLIIWDTRVDPGEEAVHVCANVHEKDINAVSFSPFSEYILATGSSDATVAIWDMRNIKKRLLSLEYHRGEVMQVQWSPHNASILASTGKDNRVFIWDLSKVGDTSVQSMEEDPAPPELSFIHGGHIAHVNDISWNHHETGMLASVTEDNILQVWKVTEDLRCRYNDDSDDDSFGGSASEAFDD